MLIWEVVNGVFTPGGDPCYRCPNCGFEHVHGIETHKEYHECPECGEAIKYPYEKDVESSEEVK